MTTHTCFTNQRARLDKALLQFGKNLAFKYEAEWSKDGKRWYDIFAKTTDARGNFTNSFEAEPGIFVHLDSIFHYFNGGQWRTKLTVETKDCASNVGVFWSTIIPLKYSIFDSKSFDLKDLYATKTDFNFKYVEQFIKDIEGLEDCYCLKFKLDWSIWFYHRPSRSPKYRRR